MGNEVSNHISKKRISKGESREGEQYGTETSERKSRTKAAPSA